MADTKYKYAYMKRGTVIKVSGDYSKLYKKYKVRQAPSSSDHNTWAVITKVRPIKRVNGARDDYHKNKLAVLETKQEGSGKKVNVLTDAVKWNIGTAKKDLLGLGKERHKSEVVSLINRYVKEERRKNIKPIRRKKYMKRRFPLQTGKTTISRDRLLSARRPGWKKAKTTGKRYYEVRRNRTDKSSKTRL